MTGLGGIRAVDDDVGELAERWKGGNYSSWLIVFITFPIPPSCSSCCCFWLIVFTKSPLFLLLFLLLLFLVNFLD